MFDECIWEQLGVRERDRKLLPEIQSKINQDQGTGWDEDKSAQDMMIWKLTEGNEWEQLKKTQEISCLGPGLYFYSIYFS